MRWNDSAESPAESLELPENLPRQNVKRALLLLPAAFSQKGGVQLYNRLLIRAFSDLGEQHGLRSEVMILMDAHRDVDRCYVGSSTEILPADRSRVRFAVTAIVRMMLFRPDVVVIGHVNFLSLAIPARLLGSRTWLVAHGIDFWHTFSGFKRLCLRCVTSIISVSRFTMREGARLNGLSEDLFRVVPCAIDPVWETEFRAALDQPRNGEPVLLTVARLAASERYKGVDDVIKALPAIAAAVPAVRYVLIGDGDDRPYLESLARELGVSDRIRFAGEVGVGELAAAYRNASLFVMPSAKEGFGVVFLEAGFFGLASIGTRSGGIPEVVTDESGVLVEYGNVEQLASSVIDLLMNPQKRAQLGGAARARINTCFSYTALRNRLGHLLMEA